LYCRPCECRTRQVADLRICSVATEAAWKVDGGILPGTDRKWSHVNANVRLYCRGAARASGMSTPVPQRGTDHVVFELLTI
jgi:hypothetical protein